MRVLLVTLGFPFPPDSGTRIRDFNLLREVSKYAQVCLCSLLTEDLPPNWEELRPYCETITTWRPPSDAPEWRSLLRPACRGFAMATRLYYFPQMAAAIRSLLDSCPVDLVQIEHSFLACYRSAIPAGMPCRTILSFHNVGSLQYRRIAALKTGLLKQAGFRIKAALMRGWEARAASRFDCSLVVSDREAGLLRAECASLRLEVIENGVDCERFQPLPEPADANTLLFLGVLGYPPNSDGILWFIREIWPAIRSASPAVCLRVAGHAPGPALKAANALPGVHVEGRVGDVVPLYEEAGMVIVPLRAGGGTRLKILEAMALGRLVVSTTLGCEGLDVAPEEHLLVADSPAEFAAQVLRGLGDLALRRRIAANARLQVESRYAWQRIGRRLFDVYSDLHATKGTLSR